MGLEIIREAASWILIGSGLIASLVGAIGIIRLPDVYARMHAAGIIDTFGVGAIMAGLIVHEGLTLISVKLLLIVGFIFFTGPVTTHALARATIHGHVKPKADGVMPKPETGAPAPEEAGVVEQSPTEAPSR